MTPVEILQSAKGLIADRTHWTQYYLARNQEGEPVPFDGPEAFSFCALGALSRYSKADPESRAAWDALVEATDCKHISNYNDALERTHEEIMAMFDKAIASFSDSNAPTPEQP